MPANTRRRIEYLLCFLFLAVGGVIYLFYRPQIMMLHVMADGLGLGSCIDCMREIAAEWPGYHGRTRTGVLNTVSAVGGTRWLPDNLVSEHLVPLPSPVCKIHSKKNQERSEYEERGDSLIENNTRKNNRSNRIDVNIVCRYDSSQTVHHPRPG